MAGTLLGCPKSDGLAPVKQQQRRDTKSGSLERRRFICMESHSLLGKKFKEVSFVVLLSTVEPSSPMYQKKPHSRSISQVYVRITHPNDE